MAKLQYTSFGSERENDCIDQVARISNIRHRQLWTINQIKKDPCVDPRKDGHQHLNDLRAKNVRKTG